MTSIQTWSPYTATTGTPTTPRGEVTVMAVITKAKEEVFTEVVADSDKWSKSLTSPEEEVTTKGRPHHAGVEGHHQGRLDTGHIPSTCLAGRQLDLGEHRG